MEKALKFLLPCTLLVLTVVLLILDLTQLASPSKHTAEGTEALRQGNYALAIRELGKSQQICESDISARFKLGAAYQNYGWHDEALKEYEAAWNLGVINAGPAAHSAGRIWFHRKRFKEAVDCFQKALSLSPNSPEIWNELGEALLALSRNNEALAAFERAAQLDPQNGNYKLRIQSLRNKIK